MTPTKRRHERFAADIPCRLYIPGDKGKAPKFEAFARLRDLSLGGVFVESAVRFKRAPELFVELKLPDGKLPIQGRVVRQPDGGLGIAFGELSVKERERILAHFVPEQHRRFHDDVVRDVFPKLGVDRVSLLLHLWEDWSRRAAR
jgi:hypothetical protein